MSDFSGYATKNDLLCSDGRIIRKDAFKHCDGQKVPLVWNHSHNDPFNVLGYAILHNCEDGVRADCTFNEDTDQGRNAKALVKHGDIFGLSIFANGLKQKGSDVLHGDIKEVSLVLAGANPGALIDDIAFAHSDEDEGEAVIYTGEEIWLSHADDEKKPEEKPEPDKEKKEMADEEKKPEEKKEMSIEEKMNSFSKEDQDFIYGLIGKALEEGKKGGSEEDKDDGEEKEEMKHNVFDAESTNNDQYLSHSDMQEIFADAKRCGSLREAVEAALDGGTLAHSIDTTGMTVPQASEQAATNGIPYGFNNPAMLFPDYKSLNNPPEWISRKMDWVSVVMSGVHHTPFSRIKSVFANITEDEARAKGYIKGNLKKEEVFSLLKRTTDPQTIYKKQKMDRDDIIDITDFDVVAWIRAEMRVMLNEEIARAILIGDGRLASSDDKIQELHVRPIATDVPLFNITTKVSVAHGADWETKAKSIMNAAIRARKGYKGSGNPTFFTTEDVLTDFLLLEDGIGHKLYKSEAEVATALRVSKIVTVEPMENYTITVGAKDYPLIGVIVNLSDYNVGADKGGEVNMFDDFDIDYNQYKYLIETRISGALTKPFSAITLVMDEAAAGGAG